MYEPELYSEWPGKLLENLEQPLIQADLVFVKITVVDVLKMDSRGLWCSGDKFRGYECRSKIMAARLSVRVDFGKNIKAFNFRGYHLFKTSEIKDY